MCQADPRLLVAALSSDDIDVLLVIIGILRSMTSSAENRSIADCTTVRLMDERLKRFIEAGGLAASLARGPEAVVALDVGAKFTRRRLRRAQA